MTHHALRISPLIALASLLLAPGASAQAPVDLTSWTAESYPAVSGFGAGVWTVAADSQSVFQSVNGQPTLFVSDFNAFYSEVEGVVRVSGSDDDYVGFAIGYQPGDVSNSAADYLLIDWKGVTQSFNFGAPSCTPGSVASAGLAVSRISGIPTADEFWGHLNFDDPACSDASQGLQELARGANLGSTGWTRNVDYRFRFEFTPSRLRVFVDDTLELDIFGSFADGRLAFYNFSQASVTYSGFELTPIAVEPATWGGIKSRLGVNTKD